MTSHVFYCLCDIISIRFKKKFSVCACICFEDEGNLLTQVSLIFFRLKGFLTRYFSALLPFGKFSSVVYVTFHCLSMFFLFEN